jgi:hypothetical protein
LSVAGAISPESGCDTFEYPDTKKSVTPFRMTRQEKKKIADPKIVTDAVHMAEEAGLRYVSHDQP